MSGRAALLSGRPLVACVGVYIVDVLGRPVSELPSGQRSHRLDEIRLTPAGTAGGTSVDLARFGARVSAVGAVGDDLLGRFLRLALDEEGVDTRHLVVKPDVQTSATILPIHPDGSRPAWHVPGANALLDASDIPWELVEAADAVHLGGLTALPRLDGAPAAELLRRARAGGALTTADCLGVKRSDGWELLVACLPHVDVFLPNEHEALELTGAADVPSAVRALCGLGATSVVVTCGADGSVVGDADGVRHVPALDAAVVDTTGCGDAFCAGVVVARCAGWSLDDAVDFGTAAAALTLRGLGSDAGARSADEVLAFLDARIQTSSRGQHAQAG